MARNIVGGPLAGDEVCLEVYHSRKEMPKSYEFWKNSGDMVAVISASPKAVVMASILC